MSEQEINQFGGGDDFAAVDLTANQKSYAESLDVDLLEVESLADLIQRIEGRLGQRNIQELTRWFMLSVYRHVKRKKWVNLDEFDLSEELQNELVIRLVEKDDFKQSIVTVLKDLRCRYTLLKFGKSRNPARQTLSNATKAFKQTQQMLRDAELLPAKPKKKSQNKAPELDQEAEIKTPNKELDYRPEQQAAVTATASNRRASRRGFAAESPSWETPPPSESNSDDDSLSEEEFALLDEALSDGSEGSAQRWTYNTNEERISLLSGVLAGAAACMLLLWIIY